MSVLAYGALKKQNVDLMQKIEKPEESNFKRQT